MAFDVSYSSHIASLFLVMKIYENGESAVLKSRHVTESVWNQFYYTFVCL